LINTKCFECHCGIHPFPFPLPSLNSLKYKIDKKTEKSLGEFMVNVSATALKNKSNNYIIS